MLGINSDYTDWRIQRLTKQQRIQYSSDHEWITVEGDIATIGISIFAQDRLGDIVYVELPEDASEFERGDEIGVIESVKSVSEIIAPVSGTVTAINEKLVDEPDLANKDPLNEGWICKLKLWDTSQLDDLMGEEEYSKFCEESE